MAPGLPKDMQEKIKEILDGAELTELSVKKIRTKLEDQFGDLVAQKKLEIKEFINKCVKEMSA